MHHELYPALSKYRSILPRFLSKSSKRCQLPEAPKGVFGLSTLHTPPRGSASADLIFIHGLGGGSRSTWTKSGKPCLYWPMEWLPVDDDFQDVRIHSFGYDSNWDREGILRTDDFANALLGSIIDCPTIPRDARTPLVFISHSMGGLVAKRAYLLAKGRPELESIASRVEAMFFLATPHRGADLAQSFSKLLELASAPRTLVTELRRNSQAIQSINEDFPQYCQDLHLVSFYETLPTNFGVRKRLVVEKDMAVLGYANERREYLHANHREVCKFDSRSDPNYRTVRNAIASVLGALRDRYALERRSIGNYERRLLDAFLEISDSPEDDFMAADSLRMAGSCEWLIDRVTFQEWVHDTSPPIYVIVAKPATGKTILSGKVISQLRELRRCCSFFFFQYGKKEKSNIASFLLSMARQMALFSENVRATCLEIYEKDDQLSKADYRTIWRKLFVEGILKVTFEQTHYWVIDALDECKSETEVVSLIMKVAEVESIRILVTSRNDFNSGQRLGLSNVRVHSEHVQEQDTKTDIALYLEANVEELPSVDVRGQHHIARQILDMSRGCFLWVNLVIQELAKVHTSADVQKILDEVPTDMNEMFARILGCMQAATYGKALTKAILTWTVCATRSLTTLELHEALQLDLNDTTDSVEASVRSSCGQLVYIDAQSQVQMIHLTARDFLLQASTNSEFAVDEKVGHRRLLLTCLRYLNGDDMRGSRRRKPGARSVRGTLSPFVNYACNSLFEHTAQLSWTDTEALLSLANFFSSPNVLFWIEYIANHSDLYRLIQTGSALGTFVQGSSDSSSAHVEEIALLKSWATDLIRLVMKFGNNLRDTPSSIFDLISPFCPPYTSLRKQFGSAPHSITVIGLRTETWDDCLSTVVNAHERYWALACSKLHFAIGCFSGKIILFKQLTCQEVATFNHGEPVTLLDLGSTKDILVSVGHKTIRVWDLSTQEQLWCFDVSRQCITVKLTDRDRLLFGVSKDHCLKTWDLNNGDLVADVDWTKGLGQMTSRPHCGPITAAFSVDAGLLAIIYKGHDIFIWDLESDSVHGFYSRESGALGDPGIPYRTMGVRCLAFGNAANAHLLASAYQDGELIVFDTSTGAVKSRVDALFAHLLTCSPDGSILAVADPSGTIQLFCFETMHLLYRVNSVDPGIQSLSFSDDGLRLFDIRGSQCRVWGPTALAGWSGDQELEDPAGSLEVAQEISLESSENVVLITSIACDDKGEVFFCGKEDGSIYLYDIASGLQSRKLFSHAKGITIRSLYFEKESHTITSVDTAARVMVHRLRYQHLSMVAAETLFDYRADMAVEQVVCEPGLHHILVCSGRSDVLWSISPDGNSLLKTIRYRDREPYRWVNHTTNPEQLILVTPNQAHIFDWTSLQRLTRQEGITLKHNYLPSFSISSITPCFNGSMLATVFHHPYYRRQSKPKILFWKASDFSPESTSITPVSADRNLCDSVELLIGSTGKELEQTERLVFLDNRDWVCAVDLQSVMEGPPTRHFFFPSDWLSTNLKLIIEVNEKGDIILVKRDEVAVVRRGLLSKVTSQPVARN